MKYLVTGGSGYLGGKFAIMLEELNKDYLCLGRLGHKTNNQIKFDNEVLSHSNVIELKKYISNWLKGEPVTVIHFASKFISKHNSSDISDIIDSNIKYGTEILESIAGLHTKKFINICSAWQSPIFYPDLFTLYGTSKQAFLEILEFYKRDSNVGFSNIYLFDNYGENDSRGKIVQLLIDAAISGRRLDLRSKSQVVNLLHVDDVLRAILRVLEFENGHESFVVQSKDFISLEELSNEVIKIHGGKIDLNWDAQEGRPISAKKDSGLAIPPPNWTEEIPLHIGLKRVYDQAIQKL